MSSINIGKCGKPSFKYMQPNTNAKDDIGVLSCCCGMYLTRGKSNYGESVYIDTQRKRKIIIIYQERKSITLWV